MANVEEAMKRKDEIKRQDQHTKGRKDPVHMGQQMQAQRPDKIGQGANIRQNTRNQGYRRQAR
jgi:hypothetical protein